MKMHTHRPHRPLTEALESRRLLATGDFGAPTFVAVFNGTQNFSDTRRATVYYDVSDLGDEAGASLGNVETFSIFSYEESGGGIVDANFEDLAAMDVNPANGDVYQLGFDSGDAGGLPDFGSNDSPGDYDLYINRTSIAYQDFLENDRPMGIMYVPTVAPDGFDYAAEYGSEPVGPTGLPGVDSSDDGIPEGRSNLDTDPSNDIIWIDGVREKVGEIARVVGGDEFDEQEIAFIDPETLLLIENKSTGLAIGTLDEDYQIRTIERVSTSPGAATVPAADGQPGNTGGYNRQTTQSWESFAFTGDNFVDLDNNAATGSLSNVDGIGYVELDGNPGVWVSDRDGGGDDLTFFNLDFDTRVATQSQFQFGPLDAPTTGFGSFALDEDPTVDAGSNDGDIDWFDVDENGTLIISESGFFETPREEPRIITRDIVSYNAGDTDSDGVTEIRPGGYEVFAPGTPTLTDDTAVIDGRFGVYERGENRVYTFDIDPGNPGDTIRSDLYIYDLDDEAFVYEELDAANIFFGGANAILAFTLGDSFDATNGNPFANDGLVTVEDVDNLYAAGRTGTALEQEEVDLTGDGVVTLGTAAGTDSAVLVTQVVGTLFGDANLDGVINLADFGRLRAGFGSQGLFSNGNFDGVGAVNLADFGLLRSNFGQDVR
jgi:hypothetical protein